jgi:hypothetical protein
MENHELIENPKLKTRPEIPKDTVKLDIFQHIKIGLNNKDINCQCENTTDNLYYCIPCKISCCQKCTYPDHITHLLLPKEKYSLKPAQINNSFGAIESILSDDDLYKNIQQKRQELVTEIDTTCKKIESLVNEWKDKKLQEINELFDELNYNIQNLNTKKSNAKKNLNEFATRHQKFFGLRDKNKDPHNTIFLLNYDLVSIPYLWSENISKIAKSIEDNMTNYKTREINKDKNIVQRIKEILFLCEDEDPITHEKIDEKLLPLIKLKVELKDFNGDKLKELDKRIQKLNKGIDSFKNSVMNSLAKHGNYKELSRDNNIYEHRKVKGADNLFSQRKMDALSKGDENYLLPGHPIKTKNDIVLDNQILNRNFTHNMADLYDQYFRIPTIELQSSHADLKLKTSEEEEANYAKVIEGTNQIMIYDKKLNKIIKKKLKLLKNPHGYTKFPHGCRCVLVGEKLYITGGKDEYKEYPNCIIYDRKTDQIKRIMDMQNPRCYHTMIFNEVFETLMVIGGENNNTVEIFDPLTNRWQKLPELNIPRSIPLFYFDEGRGNMYAMFGVEGSFSKPMYTDTIEILDLTEIKQGWMKINYNNKSRMDLKCFLNLYPLNDFLMLIYGGLENREMKRNACIYNLVKAEMTKIDKNLMEELRHEAKTNKVLNTIVMSVSKSSVADLNESSKVLKK